VIHTYSISCFLIAPDTCKKITSAVANYWWGDSVDSHGMHWKKRTGLTRPMVSGGMGLRDIRKFNLAMLGKQGWRLMANPSSLCVQVLKGRYYPNDTILSARKKKNSSHTWRAILARRGVLEKGLIRCIGDGTTTDIWNDR
jgi:hypothetical protein